MNHPLRLQDDYSSILYVNFRSKMQNTLLACTLAKKNTASLKNSTDMSLPSARFSNYAPALRRAKFGFEVPNLMLLWFCCGCKAPNIFDGTKYNIILYDYYVESFFAPSRRGDLETLPKAQRTRGLSSKNYNLALRPSFSFQICQHVSQHQHQH